MTGNISDEDLHRLANRVSGQVIVITGGAGGIGRAAVLELAKRKAKIVIGDIDAKASDELVHAIRNTGGTAIWKTCDVLDYDDQVRLFEFALEEFGSIDVVIVNAGIGESERLVGHDVQLDERTGLPVKPKLKTVQINYISVIYTAQLAFHYFSKATNGNSLKTLVLTASILSFATLPTAPLYCSSKYGVFSLMRSLTPDFQTNGLRIASVHPWFVDTPIVPERMRALLYSIPLTPLHRVTGAIVLAVTDTLPESNGAAYTIPDEREVFRILPDRLSDEDVFAVLNERCRRERRRFENVISLYALMRLYAGKRVKIIFACVALVYPLWKISSFVLPYMRKLSL